MSMRSGPLVLVCLLLFAAARVVVLSDVPTHAHGHPVVTKPDHGRDRTVEVRFTEAEGGRWKGPLPAYTMKLGGTS